MADAAMRFKPFEGFPADDQAALVARVKVADEGHHLRRHPNEVEDLQEKAVHDRRERRLEIKEEGGPISATEALRLHAVLHVDDIEQKQSPREEASLHE